MSSTLLNLTPAQLAKRSGRLEFDPDELVDDGVVRIYEEPDHLATYVGGADFSLGIPGNDEQTACIVNNSVNPPREVASACGFWPECFDSVLYVLLRYYGGAFLVGEQQFGLPALRALYRAGCWLYFNRDERSRGRRMRDSLGYAKHGLRVADPLFIALRVKIARGQLIVRDPDTLQEMAELQYRPRAASADLAGLRDDGLDYHLPDGGSPNRVMATMYAAHACDQVVNFPRPLPPASSFYDDPEDLEAYREIQDEIQGRVRQAEAGVSWRAGSKR